MKQRAWLLACALAAVGCDGDVGIWSEVVRTDGGEPESVMRYCVLAEDGDYGGVGGGVVDLGFGVTTELRPDWARYQYWIAPEGSEADGDGVPGEEDGELAATVELDESFLGTGEVKDVTFETHHGVQFTVSFQGADDCESDPADE